METELDYGYIKEQVEYSIGNARSEGAEITEYDTVDVYPYPEADKQISVMVSDYITDNEPSRY